MRLSTKGCYALRAMVDLALHGGEPVTRQEIAARQGISADYAAQLFRHLRQAQLVKAIKGPGGGYILAREPVAISAGDVLRAVEGPLAVSQCVLPGHDSDCPRAVSCAVRPLWERLSAALTEIANSVTLWDFCKQPETETVGDFPNRKEQEGGSH